VHCHDRFRGSGSRASTSTSTSAGTSARGVSGGGISRSGIGRSGISFGLLLAYPRITLVGEPVLRTSAFRT